MSSNGNAFLFSGAAGSSRQAQEAFSNRSLLPHLRSGGLYVRTGLYLRLSLLLYTSGQSTPPPHQAQNVNEHKRQKTEPKVTVTS